MEHRILLVGATSFGVETVIFRKEDFLLKWNPYNEHLVGRDGKK